DNALKFTPKGGQVALGVRIVDGHVDVQLTDTGVGIEAEFLPRVFDRFRQGDSTTSRAYGGLGLGLSIAKHLVEAHQGAITVDSAGGDRGPTFTVRLPVAPLRTEELAEPARPPASAGAAPDAEPALDGLHVLVVDDEADAREIMAHILETSGATVRKAE